MNKGTLGTDLDLVNHYIKGMTLVRAYLRINVQNYY
jgi:hypothetical protein